MVRMVFIFLILLEGVSFADGDRYILKNSTKVEVYDPDGKYKKTIILKAGTHIVPESKNVAKKSDAGKSLTVPPAQQKGRSVVSQGLINDGNIVAALEGALIIADDGQFLGKITRNDIDSNSIFNSIGEFGSDISPTSIWNDIGLYGSDVSSYSPFNDIASSPPRIIKGDKLIGCLTLCKVKANAISPVTLLKFLDDSSDAKYRKRLLKLLD